MCPTTICWKTCRIILRRHWRTGDKIVDSILLRGFGTYFIMICYASILSQDMSYGIGARQGCISCWGAAAQGWGRKRLVQKAEVKRRCEIPRTQKHYKAQCDEADIRAREADVRVWPLRGGRSRRRFKFRLNRAKRTNVALGEWHRCRTVNSLSVTPQ
jgi:ribosomal protein L39E